MREPQRASESLRELQRAKIDDTEQLMHSFNFPKIFLSSCKPFQNSLTSLIIKVIRRDTGSSDALSQRLEYVLSKTKVKSMRSQKLRSQKHVGCWRLPTHMLLAFQLCLLRCSRGPGSCSSRSKQVECLTQWKLTPLLRVEELNATVACGRFGRKSAIMLILAENGPFLEKIESSATMALISLLGGQLRELQRALLLCL